MKYEQEILVKILQQIADKNNSIPVYITIAGIKYDPVIFDHVKFLYDEGCFTANIIRSEDNEIAQILPKVLLRNGHRYLKELLTKKEKI